MCIFTIFTAETILEEQPSAPVFAKELQTSAVREGSSHKLECTVGGNPLPTVQWYKNDTNIDNSPDYVITFNNGEAILKFDEVFLEDKASYTCKATNQWGQSSTTASLDVQRKVTAVLLNEIRRKGMRFLNSREYSILAAQISTRKPYFVVPLSNAMARTGERVKLECEASGDPIPELLWSHDGKPIEETKYHKVRGKIYNYFDTFNKALI